MRFTRARSQILGSKLFNRRDVNPRLNAERALDRGELLGLLWALFGPPAPRRGGFEYHLRDQETNLEFIAYAGPRGPSYGGDPDHRQALRAVFETFEELLDGTKPADCSIEYAAETEYGGGKWVLGCRDGRSFDVPDRRVRKSPVRVDRRLHR